MNNDFFDNVEKARAHQGQQILFPQTPRGVCQEIGLQWWSALKLHEDDWISFDPDAVAQLDEGQDAELRFIGGLVVAGCDPIFLARLVRGLKRPYCYRLGDVLYDWRTETWRCLPEVDLDPESIFRSWLEALKKTHDVDQLREIAADVTRTIEEIDSI